MNQNASLSKEQIIEKIRSDIRKNMRSPVSPQSLQSMLYRIDLKEYCCFLASMPPVDDTDYYEVYELLVKYSKLESASHEGSLWGKTLTVGLMLQKASDLIYHYQEYGSVWDGTTYMTLDAVDIGEYIVDVLLVKPVVLLESERSKS